MKKTSIASVESNAGFQERLVEKFVQENLPPRAITTSKTSGLGNFSNRYKDIECCAAELPVDGIIEILAAKRFSIPVTSRFIVFCARAEQRAYKVAWSCSLS